LQAAVQQMGEQLLSQKKTLSETRHVLLDIRQENDTMKQKLTEARARRPEPTTPPQYVIFGNPITTAQTQIK